MRQYGALISAVAYLILFTIALAWSGYCLLFDNTLPDKEHNIIFECAVAGGIGGVVYCLRGVYLASCVRRDWEDRWITWYLIRPIVSVLCGVVAFVFLKAGLLVLQAKKETGTSNLGFMAFSFIAGMNVDKFIRKIEEVAKSTWGIDRSRAGAAEDPEEKVKDPGTGG